LFIKDNSRFPILAKIWIKFLVFGLIQCINPLFAQQQIKGRILDFSNAEPISGAKVLYSGSTKFVTGTDTAGYFIIPEKWISDTFTLEVSIIGYTTIDTLIFLGKSQGVIVLYLLPSDVLLDQIVVTGSQYEQKIDELTTSVSLLQPEIIDRQASGKIESAIEQLSGVTILDGQPSIRGSSGYSYGAGSRVMVTLDGLPVLSADAQDAKFDLLPVDLIKQVEVVKGASSVLYGSAAMGGVINLITRQPGSNPETSVRFRGGIYGHPANRQVDFGGSAGSPDFSLHVSHMRKVGSVGLTFLADGGYDTGYRLIDYNKFGRFIFRSKWESKKSPGLSAGINMTARIDSGAGYLYWSSYLPGKRLTIFGGNDSIYVSGALTPAAGTVRFQKLGRYTFDPFLEKLCVNGDRHQYLGRILITDNQNDTKQNALATSWFNEYRLTKVFFKKLKTVSGVNYTYGNIKSFGFYGDHVTNSLSVFTQEEYKLTPRFLFNAGWRYQYYKVDNLAAQDRSVFRAGLNYQLSKGTFLRASAGQGFRVASVAELFVSTVAGGITLTPNPALKPEHGYSAEAGVRQVFVSNHFKGFLDFAAFRMDFKDMIEFNFVPDFQNLFLNNAVSFTSLNVSHARIDGFEVSTGSITNFNNHTIAFNFGYTWINPKDLNGLPQDSVLDAKPGPEGNYPNLLSTLYYPDRPELLKYRNKHMIRGSVEYKWRRFSLSLFGRYASAFTAIDQPLYVVVNDLESFMESKNRAYLIFDIMPAIKLSKIQLSANITNLFNEEYQVVPGLLGEQRKFTLQAKIVF
jgi:iron complex outermembrane receptor protein